MAMPYVRRRPVVLLLALAIAFFLVRNFRQPSSSSSASWPPPGTTTTTTTTTAPSDRAFSWAHVPQKYAVRSMIKMPRGDPSSIPLIQHRFSGKEDEDARRLRLSRLEAVKGNFSHAWNGYKAHAWMADEVAPLSGLALNPFGGWAASMVDGLDTLWIMGLYDEFAEAVKAIDDIDFNNCTVDEVNVFETTIRYLGGLLGAYDVSGQKYPSLLRKAVEIGQMLYVAFDTPNRMPIAHWDFKKAAAGARPKAADQMIVAEIGSLTMEFTRLTQLTGDPKYFDAVQRIMNAMEKQQSKTKLPGMWPFMIDAAAMNFRASNRFTIGGMADSLYEYLPKQYILLGGASQQYKKLYKGAFAAMDRNIFFRPMTKHGEDILFPGDVTVSQRVPLSELRPEPTAQHLSCFAGGMVGLAAKAFQNNDDMDTARKLVEGCLWAYEKSSMGIMPEIMVTVRCQDRNDCPWNEEIWKKAVEDTFYTQDSDFYEYVAENGLMPGFVRIPDRRYILRPEAIESIFILYRLTGDSSLLDRAWRMFETIVKHTVTDIAHAALDDCTIPKPTKSDRMESFWFAETLKYFYLIFSEPDVVSLDEYVLNTEAHPFRYR
ncbi:endoplasmic reticulum mannosyl-oligosaccharide 1,2-alpha-mannosidase [Trichophyton mentagrophytes]|nr:endoplasmic reticulum mannosyl-oligosaccharide 1,2-alpha-mannosidase [Trichophyton mentagrophytes]